MRRLASVQLESPQLSEADDRSNAPALYSGPAEAEQPETSRLWHVTLSVAGGPRHPWRASGAPWSVWRTTTPSC